MEDAFKGLGIGLEIDENGEVQYVSHDMYVIDQFDLVVKNGFMMLHGEQNLVPKLNLKIDHTDVLI